MAIITKSHCHQSEQDYLVLLAISRQAPIQVLLEQRDLPGIAEMDQMMGVDIQSLVKKRGSY